MKQASASNGPGVFPRMSWCVFLAMFLFYDDDYEEVMRKLVGSLKDMGSWRDEWSVPSTSAITQARQRLAADPLRVLFDKTTAPVATGGTKGASWDQGAYLRGSGRALRSNHQRWSARRAGPPAHSLRHPKTYVPRRGRSRPRSRPPLLQAITSRHPPPSHRPGGLFALNA